MADGTVLEFSFSFAEAEVINNAVERLWDETRLELARLRSEPNADRFVIELCEDQERISLCLWERVEAELNAVPPEQRPPRARGLR